MIQDPSSTPAVPESLRCGDKCGREVVDQAAAEMAGWSFLPITARWRCGPCGAALYAASSMVGMGDGITDKLPPGSRGALPKSTADSIVIPYLKG